MKTNQSGALFVGWLKTLIKTAFKLFVICLAWTLKYSGLILCKLGETIEAVTVKFHR